MKTLTRSLALFLALQPALALAQSPPNIAAQHLWGRLGIPGDVGPSQAIPFATLGSKLGTDQALTVYKVGSLAYPTPQSAVNAAIAANGGIVWFPCQTWSLPSGTVGLDLSNAQNVTLAGPFSQNSGGAACGQIAYSGTGTAIKATGSVGLRIRGLNIVATSAAKVIDIGGVGAAQTAYALIEGNLIYGPAGVGVAAYDTVSSTIQNNTIFGAVGIQGRFASGDVSNAISIIGNTFGAGGGTNLKNAGTWLIQGNTFEGPTGNAYLDGAGVGQCYNINFISNAFADPTGTPPPWIDATCYNVTTSGNDFGSLGTQTNIKIENSSGSLSSTGDTFESANIAIDIGTGNALNLTTPKVGPGTVTTLINGTPSQSLTPFGLLYSNGYGTPPTSMAAGTNGQIPVGQTGTTPLWKTPSGDCTVAASGAITCTKTNSVAFAPSATTDTTNGTNIASGTVANARMAAVNLAAGNVNGGVTGTLPIANGGTGDTGTAWTAYTPTATAQTPGATPPTFTSVTGRYKQIGKTVFAQMEAVVNAAGTGAGSLRVTLPFASASNDYAGSAFESAIAGKSGAAIIIQSVSTAFLSTRDATGTTWFANGADVTIGITYEVP